MEKECKIHGLVKHFTRSDSNTLRCSKCASEAVSKHRQKLKLRAVELKGGECSVCGYRKSQKALQFHHRDPNKKSFGISDKGVTISWEKLKKELEKCDLLCANCHAELH